MLDYWLLFSSGFISSTLLPGGSELLWLYYLNQGEINLVWGLLAISVGNTLGSIVTFMMGFYFRFGQQKTAQKYPKVLRFCQRWGHYSLLLAWLPVVGDVICLLAGWLKLPKRASFIAIFIGKSARYLLLMLLFFSV